MKAIFSTNILPNEQLTTKFRKLFKCLCSILALLDAFFVQITMLMRKRFSYPDCKLDFVPRSLEAETRGGGNEINIQQLVIEEFECWYLVRE